MRFQKYNLVFKVITLTRSRFLLTRHHFKRQYHAAYNNTPSFLCLWRIGFSDI